MPYLVGSLFHSHSIGHIIGTNMQYDLVWLLITKGCKKCSMSAVSALLKEYTFTDFCLDMSHPLMSLTIESPAIIILFFLSEMSVDLGPTLAELSVTVTL